MQHIKIIYQSKTSSDFVELNLSPEEYYDELESGDRSFAEDGIPKHLNLMDYIPLDASEVQLVVITEPSNSGKSEIRIQLLDGETSICSHSIRPDGTEELIHTTDIDNDTYHVTRTIKDVNGYWTVVMNTVARDTSQNYFAKDCVGEFSYEQLLRFWHNYAAKFSTS